MYTNGLKDRFGSPLISMRDLLKYWNENLPTYEFLDARGSNTTDNDMWGTTLSVTTDGTKITVTHNDNKLSFLSTSVIKNGTTVTNDKVTVGDLTVNIQPQNVISSEGCTNVVVLSLLNPNTEFSVLKVLKGQETLSETNVDGGVRICLPDVEKIEDTKFKAFGYIETDFPKLKVASSVFGGDLVTCIIGDYPQLVYTSSFSANATSLQEVKCNFPYLMVATDMFSGCTSLEYFVGDLSNLVTAKGMFANTNLEVDTVRYIWKSLPYIDDFHTDFVDYYVEDGEKYVIPVYFRDVVEGEVVNSTYNMEIAKADVGKITISWADLEDLAAQDRAIILHELFPLIKDKGWTIETNLVAVFDDTEE